MSPKRVLITGACQDGYGQMLTEKMLLDGHSVLGTYQSDISEKAKQYAEGKESLVVLPVDFDNKLSIDIFVQKIKGDNFDAVVFAEMFYGEEDFDNYDYEMWDKSIAINLTGPNSLFHKIRDNITGGGSVVFVTSIDGFKGSFNSTGYSASKAAVHNLVMSLAVNFGGQLRVNAVAAGWIENVMGDYYEPFDKNAKDFTPMKRNGKPSEVANVVSFLLSEESSFINGHILTVDGGYGCVDYVSKSEYEYRMRPK